MMDGAESLSDTPAGYRRLQESEEYFGLAAWTHEVTGGLVYEEDVSSALIAPGVLRLVDPASGAYFYFDEVAHVSSWAPLAAANTARENAPAHSEAASHEQLHQLDATRSFSLQSVYHTSVTTATAIPLDPIKGLPSGGDQLGGQSQRSKEHLDNNQQRDFKNWHDLTDLDKSGDRQNQEPEIFQAATQDIDSEELLEVLPCREDCVAPNNSDNVLLHNCEPDDRQLVCADAETVPTETATVHRAIAGTEDLNRRASGTKMAAQGASPNEMENIGGESDGSVVRSNSEEDGYQVVGGDKAEVPNDSGTLMLHSKRSFHSTNSSISSSHFSTSNSIRVGGSEEEAKHEEDGKSAKEGEEGRRDFSSHKGEPPHLIEHVDREQQDQEAKYHCEDQFEMPRQRLEDITTSPKDSPKIDRNNLRLGEEAKDGDPESGSSSGRKIAVFTTTIATTQAEEAIAVNAVKKVNPDDPHSEWFDHQDENTATSLFWLDEDDELEEVIEKDEEDEEDGDADNNDNDDDDDEGGWTDAEQDNNGVENENKRVSDDCKSVGTPKSIHGSESSVKTGSKNGYNNHDSAKIKINPGVKSHGGALLDNQNEEKPRFERGNSKKEGGSSTHHSLTHREQKALHKDHSQRLKHRQLQEDNHNLLNSSPHNHDVSPMSGRSVQSGSTNLHYHTAPSDYQSRLDRKSYFALERMQTQMNRRRLQIKAAEDVYLKREAEDFDSRGGRTRAIKLTPAQLARRKRILAEERHRVAQERELALMKKRREYLSSFYDRQPKSKHTDSASRDLWASEIHLHPNASLNECPRHCVQGHIHRFDLKILREDSQESPKRSSSRTPKPHGMRKASISSRPRTAPGRVRAAYTKTKSRPSTAQGSLSPSPMLDLLRQELSDRLLQETGESMDDVHTAMLLRLEKPSSRRDRLAKLAVIKPPKMPTVDIAYLERRKTQIAKQKSSRNVQTVDASAVTARNNFDNGIRDTPYNQDVAKPRQQQKKSSRTVVFHDTSVQHGTSKRELLSKISGTEDSLLSDVQDSELDDELMSMPGVHDSYEGNSFQSSSTLTEARLELTKTSPTRHRVALVSDDVLSQVFRAIDTSGDGFVDLKELRSALREKDFVRALAQNAPGLNMLLRPEFCQAVFECIDVDESGDVSLEEFIRVFGLFLNESEEERQRRVDFRRLFDTMDRDGDGSIDMFELRNALRNDNNIREMLKCSPVLRVLLRGSAYHRISSIYLQFDEDNSGTLEWPEFLKVCQMTFYNDADT